MSILTLVVYALPPIALILSYKFIDHRSKHMHCICPNCGSSFKVAPLTILFTIRMGFMAFLTCPVCGYKGMMNFIEHDK